MARIFLSHASEDVAAARRIRDALRGAGHAVWLPEDEIDIGESIPAAIARGLTGSDFLGGMSTSTIGMGSVDVLIITALEDELDAVLELGGQEAAWVAPSRRRGSPSYHVRDFVNDRGLPLRIGAAWTGQMGAVAAAALAQDERMPPERGGHRLADGMRARDVL